MSTETDEQIRADLRRFRELSKKAGEASALADRVYAQWVECNSDASSARQELDKFLAELAKRGTCTCPQLSGYEAAAQSGHERDCPEYPTVPR